MFRAIENRQGISVPITKEALDFLTQVEIKRQEMENKFYTPTIDEFKVGYCFEKAIDVNGEKQWTKMVYEISADTLNIETISGLLANGDIRVKCLDDNDLKEINAEQTYLTDRGVAYLINDHYELFIDLDDNLITISHSDDIVKFEGYIRNFNELLDIMRMLNIKTP